MPSWRSMFVTLAIALVAIWINNNVAAIGNLTAKR